MQQEVCPICLEVLKIDDSPLDDLCIPVIPMQLNCGHCICVTCFLTNLTYKDNCCICRGKIEFPVISLPGFDDDKILLSLVSELNEKFNTETETHTARKWITNMSKSIFIIYISNDTVLIDKRVLYHTVSEKFPDSYNNYDLSLGILSQINQLSSSVGIISHPNQYFVYNSIDDCNTFYVLKDIMVDGDSLSLTIRMISGIKYEIITLTSDTINDVKRKISNVTEIPTTNFMLVLKHSPQIFETLVCDSESIQERGIDSESSLYAKLKLRGD